MESLRHLVKDTLIQQVFRDKRRPVGSRGQFAWSVLVLNAGSLKIVQACMHTYELTAENIACVDMLEDEKRPPTSLHAIYFLMPDDIGLDIFKELNKDFKGQNPPSEFDISKVAKSVGKEYRKSRGSIRRAMSDLAGSSIKEKVILQHLRNFRRYNSATVYFCRPFVEKYRQEFQNALGEPIYKKYILCLDTVPCSIVPVQGTAFSLGLKDSISEIYFPKREKQREEVMKLIGELLASLWQLLGQYPTMMIRKPSTENAELAHAIQLNLERISTHTTLTSSTAILVVIDRGADLKTPLMHDIAFQPMIYDLLPTDGEFYTYKEQEPVGENQTQLNQAITGNTSKIGSTNYNVSLLNEDDPDWMRLRYLPMPEVLDEFLKELKLTKIKIAEKQRNSKRLSDTGSMKRRLERSYSVVQFTATLQSIKSELEGLLMALSSNRNCVLNKSVIKNYAKRIVAVSHQLDDKARLNFSTDACLVIQVAKLMRNSSKKMQHVTEKCNLPKVLECIEEEVSLIEADKQPDFSTAQKELSKEIESLLGIFTYFEERIQVADVCEKQLQLALEIGNMFRNKKLQYFKNCYVHLAVSCLEQLRVRELYDVFPLESLCYAISLRSKEVTRNEWTRLSETVIKLLESKRALITSDKIRIITLLALASDGLDDQTLESVLKAGSLSQEDKQVILGLQQLGGHILKSNSNNSTLDEWSQTANVAMRSKSSSSCPSKNQLKPPFTSALGEVLHEGWRKLGLVTKSHSKDPLTTDHPPDGAKSESAEKANGETKLRKDEKKDSFEWIPLVAHLAKALIEEKEEDLLKFFRVLRRRERSWCGGGTCDNRDSIGSNDSRVSSNEQAGGKIPANRKSIKSPRESFRTTKGLRPSSSSPFILDGLLSSSSREHLLGDKNQRPTIMIFIIGGMTHSEMRHIQQLHEKHFPSRKVMIGSTHIITPASFIHEIADCVSTKK